MEISLSFWTIGLMCQCQRVTLMRSPKNHAIMELGMKLPYKPKGLTRIGKSNTAKKNHSTTLFRTIG